MTRCVWQGVATVAALVAWRIFADDFATGALAAATAYLIATVFADLRFGPVTTPQDARNDVLDVLNARDRIN